MAGVADLHDPLTDKPNPVMLVHGLHQAPWCMQLLSNRLTQQGFCTHTVRYFSLQDSIDQHAKRLHKTLLAVHDQSKPIDLVAHSLGGLVIRQWLHDYPDWHVGRIITLGTPHNGSVTAHTAKRLLPFMVGGSYLNCLDGNCPALHQDFDVQNLGIIAGDKAFGLGSPVLGFYQLKNHLQSSHTRLSTSHFANDGTVYVDETRLDGAHHLVMPVTHTGMLTNHDVHRQVAYFLRHGRFDT